MLSPSLFLAFFTLVSAHQDALLFDAIGDCLPETKFYSLTLMTESDATMDDAQLNDFVEKYNLKLSDENTLYSIFVQETEKKSWEQHGLPNTKFYNINALLLKIACRWSLLVDPEQQTINWVKSVENLNNLKVFKADDAELCKKISKCIELGSPVIVENVVDELDSKLDKLIQKTYFVENGLSVVELGEEKIRIHVN